MEQVDSVHMHCFPRTATKASYQTVKAARIENGLKTLAFWLMLFVPVFAVFELASHIIVKRAVPSRILHRAYGGESVALVKQAKHSADSPRVVRAVATTNQADGLALFHPVLGWDYPPGLNYEDNEGISYSHGMQGERRCVTDFDTTLIASYGDSFTYCAGVTDEHTWQNFLGEKLGTNVLNFGVGGYGTDQALLKYELHDGLPPKIAMLCVFPENVNRVVNIYRPFYTYSDSLRLTKPFFVRDGDKIRLIPNPITSVADLPKLDQEEYLEELGKVDYWYQLDRNLPKFSFPYTLSFLSWRGPVFAQLVAQLGKFSTRRSRHPWNLFDEDGPLSIMCYIADRFVATARSRGSEPLIVIMPYKDFVTEINDNGVVRVAGFLEYLSAKGYPFLDAVKCVADMKPSKDDLEKWYEEHASGEGNKVLADILSRYLLANYSYFNGAPGKRATDPKLVRADVKAP
ncbi:MAG: SGNH/GDSL hydrolase family protein [Desulfomonile tiedjei]|uniref:SGNH/GDSL hydrolase family protein n=1 Tax=Desulfomonile tiedjei TaxID=2358 RepID=A0A9D6Z8I1_9BACT|nr:SGNH/GDSL hydrolase family protein [Desulfomonile tiedjei]